MSFLTEYFDEYRQHAIKKTTMCRPENRWAALEGQWLDPKVGTQDKEWTEDEVKKFIKATMKSPRGQSTYYNDYCGNLDRKTTSAVPPLGKTEYQNGVSKLGAIIMRDKLHRK